ncbi:MAG: hypothetical protein AABX47_06260 [Nanoarchaeota archaeon]
MNRTPDLAKARSLSKNALDSFLSTRDSGSGSARFLIKNYYSCVIEYCQAILAAEGIVLHGRDHHKEMIDMLGEMGILDQYLMSVLDNLRRIRNDIQYYGTKSDLDIQAFYDLNKGNIQAIILRLQERSQTLIP